MLVAVIKHLENRRGGSRRAAQDRRSDAQRDAEVEHEICNLLEAGLAVTKSNAAPRGSACGVVRWSTAPGARCTRGIL